MKVYKIDLFKYLPMKTTDIVGTSPPLIKEGGGGGRTFQKLSHLVGYQRFC